MKREPLKKDEVILTYNGEVLNIACHEAYLYRRHTDGGVCESTLPKQFHDCLHYWDSHCNVKEHLDTGYSSKLWEMVDDVNYDSDSDDEPLVKRGSVER